MSFAIQARHAARGREFVIAVGLILLVPNALVLLDRLFVMGGVHLLSLDVSPVATTTLLCFVLASTALLLFIISMRTSRKQILLASAVIAVAIYGLLDGEVTRGMAPNTAVSFMLAGGAIVILNLPRFAMAATLAGFLALMIMVISIAGGISNVLGYDILLGWFQHMHMANYTSAGLLIFSIGLLRVAYLHDAGEKSEQANVYRIIVLASLILIGFLLLISLGTLSVVASQNDIMSKATMGRALDDRSKLFEGALSAATDNVTGILSQRPRLNKLMQQMDNGGGNRDQQAEIGEILGNIMASGKFVAVELQDINGKTIGAAGRFTEHPRIVVPVRAAHATELLWDDYYTARIRVDSRNVGSVVAEVLLPNITGLLADYASLSDTGEMVICGAAGADRMQCFPSRFSPKGMTLPRVMRGMKLPMSYALDGENGIRQLKDYRGQEVIDAFKPLANTGLGMVFKMDMAELYQPLYGQISIFLLVALSLILLGVGLLYRLVGPLVRQIVRAKANLSAVLNNVAEGIVTINSKGMVESFNPAASRMFGYAPAEVIGNNISMLMPEPYRAGHGGYLERYLQTGEKQITGHAERQVEGRRKDGSVFPMGLLVSAMNQGGRQVFIGVTRDMTESVNVMRILRDSEQEQRRLAGLQATILEALPANIAMIDRDGQVLAANSAWESFVADMGGAGAGLMIGGNFLQACAHASEGMQSGLVQSAAGVSAVLAGDSAVYSTEYACPYESGLKWFGMTVNPFSSGNMTGAVIVHRDISERKEREEQLRKSHEKLQQAYSHLEAAQQQLLQSEKMSSIGQLAAGVAHEINNPIGYVSSNLGALEKYLGDIIVVLDKYEEIERLLVGNENLCAEMDAFKQQMDLSYIKGDVVALINESKEGLARVKKIVQDLKDFSHPDVANEWRLANLEQGLDSTLNIVWNELKYKVEVRKEYGAIPDIECLPSQLNQVFMNLLVNAGHAIADRGVITLRTGQRGDLIWIEVEDTGNGISKENLSRIFDPFFTTKPIGKGTGLGLALAYGIVQKHAGRMEVASEIGVGTTFRIWLPVHHLEAVDAAA